MSKSYRLKMTGDIGWMTEDLRCLKSNGPRLWWFGICSNTDVSGMDIGVAVALWPKFSGDTCFPIPAVGHDTPDEEYRATHKWDRSHLYGRLRWELLDFLIDYFEEWEEILPTSESCVRFDTAQLNFSPEFLSWAVVQQWRQDGQPLTLLCNGWEM